MLLRVDQKTVIETALIELIIDRGDGKLSILLSNQKSLENIACRATLADIGTRISLVALSDDHAMPTSAIAMIRQRSDGRADIESVRGGLYVSRDAFSTIAPTL
jgi:hypothetical protein